MAFVLCFKFIEIIVFSAIIYLLIETYQRPLKV